MDTNQPELSKREQWGNWFRRLRDGVKRSTPFAAGVLAALLGLFLYNALLPGPAQLTAQDVNETVAQAMASATPPPAYSARVFQIIQPSLVLIQTKGGDSRDSHDNGLGSGVVIDDAADILTSLHVVEGATEIEVVFADGTRSKAVVIAAQPEIDIAILSPETLPTLIVPAVLGNPNALNVGDEVYAVGNPFGLYSSMSAGVVSGFDRSFRPEGREESIEGLIQIDAAVNPGNSGGPLLNRDGYVMGIVTGIINPTEQNFFIGIGFAVPITVAAGGAGLPPY
jgi:S1-C subfamily serine protease